MASGDTMTHSRGKRRQEQEIMGLQSRRSVSMWLQFQDEDEIAQVLQHPSAPRHTRRHPYFFFIGICCREIVMSSSFFKKRGEMRERMSGDSGGVCSSDPSPAVARAVVADGNSDVTHRRRVAISAANHTEGKKQNRNAL